MVAADQLLDRVLAWAGSETAVRAVVLVGSRARSASPDDLADFDLQVYVTSPETYTRDGEWFTAIGPVWLWVRDEYPDGGITVPTHLVIFAGGVKADFAFYPAGVISNGVRTGLPHRFLLDKDGAAARLEIMPAASPAAGMPDADEFARIVREFWFEAYHVAKYLARDELLLVKWRDWATKQFLLTMIDWHERAVRGRADGAAGPGERLTMAEDTWNDLHHVFAGFGREASWEAAFATMGLFRRLAGQTAAALGFAYPAALDESLTGFIQGLRERERARPS